MEQAVQARRGQLLQRRPGSSAGQRLLELLAALLPTVERDGLSARVPLDVVRGSRNLTLVGLLGGGVLWALCLIGAIRAEPAASAGELRDFSSAPAHVEGRGSPLAFALSPMGLGLEYAVLTSFARFLSLSLNGDALADPLLALLVWAKRGLTRRVYARQRLRRLGPERPDRVTACCRT